jgi:hypothetical protein
VVLMMLDSTLIVLPKQADCPVGHLLARLMGMSQARGSELLEDPSSWCNGLIPRTPSIAGDASVPALPSFPEPGSVTANLGRLEHAIIPGELSEPYIF